MTNISVTGIILSMKEYNNVANILLVDRDNPKGVVYKVALWEADAIAAVSKLNNGDEITVNGKVYAIGCNKYGSYIELRMCKMVGMAKVQRTVIQSETEVVEDDSDSLPPKGE